MLKYIKKIIFLIVFLVVLSSTYVFAENIGLEFFYGIGNVAKNGNLLPIELRVTNKDNQDFVGTADINIYESNNSVYVYRVDLDVKAHESVLINKNLSVNNKSNTIIIEIYNSKEELVTSERTSLDLSYLDDRMIIGAITSDFNSLNYIDDCSLAGNALRTKLVEINEEMFERNKNLLDQLDALIISDIDIQKLSAGFNYAIYNFFISGKPIFIGLGGKNGVYTMPDFLYQYTTGPLFDIRRTIDFAKGCDLKSERIKNVDLTQFDFIDAKKIIEYDSGISLETLRVDSNMIVCSPYSFNDLNDVRDNKLIISNIIEQGFGKNRLDKIVNLSGNLANNDYYNISNLLNIIDKMKLPDIFLLSILLVLYLSIITIIIYVYLRSIDKRVYYGRCVFAFGVLFTFVMLYFGFRVMKKNTFLTYISIVDIHEESTKENAFLNFRTSESASYSFNTSSNNKIYPIIKDSNEPIISRSFMDIKSTKYTTFTNEDNRTKISVTNAGDFDSNVFAYINNNYLNDIYNIDCDVSRFNGNIDGRITNNMDVKISDACILMYGKVLKIGDIEPSHSVTLLRAEAINAPIGNNSMLSEILGSNNNQNIYKYYLDENVYDYYSYAMFFGFIDNNGTLDIKSNDVGDVYGRTLLIKRVVLSSKEMLHDICTLEEEVNNISGYYDNDNNSINGDTEVINEYSFDNSYNINNIYFEELSNYDKGNINYNVPFYGDIEVFNVNTKLYERLYDGNIDYQSVKNYLSADNKIIVKYIPSSRDPLYRKLSLPVIRAVASR